jgi:flagellar protein FlaJ
MLVRITEKEKKIVWVISVALGIAVLTSVFAVTFVLGTELPLAWDDFLIVAIMIAIFPPAGVNYIDRRWRIAVDSNIPKLLREIADASRTGLTLIRAIEVSAERRYGPLTDELKRLVRQLSWGATLEDALQSFANRVNTRLAKRTAILLTEVSRAGGNIQEITDSLQRHVSDLQLIDKERRGQLRQYVAIVYVAVFILLFINVILLKTFFGQLETLEAIQAEQPQIQLVAGAIDILALKKVFFHTAVIESFFGGLIAGKMGEGSLGAGMKHALILMLMSFLTFAVLVWGWISIGLQFP